MGKCFAGKYKIACPVMEADSFRYSKYNDRGWFFHSSGAEKFGLSVGSGSGAGVYTG